MQRTRPDERATGYQRWTNLLFVHWRVTPESIQALLPEMVQVETFDGAAWIGLVAFEMSGVRPWWFPAIPFVSRFLETNVRTYVVNELGESGVWFFSLDAMSQLAVEVARWRWKLPYFHSRMTLEQAEPPAVSTEESAPPGFVTPSTVKYESQRVDRRCKPDALDASVSLAATLGAPRRLAPQLDTTSDLDRFLVDRYVLFTEKQQELLRGEVFHGPYPLTAATLTACQQSLTDAIGLPMDHAPDHVVFSRGVEVDIFPLRRVLS